MHLKISEIQFNISVIQMKLYISFSHIRSRSSVKHFMIYLNHLQISVIHLKITIHLKKFAIYFKISPITLRNYFKDICH